jgi:hypothetical protein
MKFQDALESGYRFRRPGWHWVERFADRLRCTGDGFMIHPTLADFLADDWEVQEPKVEITRQQFWDAYKESMADCYLLTFADGRLLSRMADKIFGETR